MEKSMVSAERRYLTEHAISVYLIDPSTGQKTGNPFSLPINSIVILDTRCRVAVGNNKYVIQDAAFIYVVVHAGSSTTAPYLAETAQPVLVTRKKAPSPTRSKASKKSKK